MIEMALTSELLDLRETQLDGVLLGNEPSFLVPSPVNRLTVAQLVERGFDADLALHQLFALELAFRLDDGTGHERSMRVFANVILATLSAQVYRCRRIELSGKTLRLELSQITSQVLDLPGAWTCVMLPVQPHRETPLRMRDR